MKTTKAIALATKAAVTSFAGRKASLYSPDQARDDHGRFGSGGNEHSAVVSVVSDAIGRSLEPASESEGGFYRSEKQNTGDALGTSTNRNLKDLGFKLNGVGTTR